MASVSPTPLLDLAETISRTALIVTKSLLQEKHASAQIESPKSPSGTNGSKAMNGVNDQKENSEVNSAPKVPPGKELRMAKQALSQAASELLIHAMGPDNYLKSFSYGYYDLAALGVVLEFNIASLVPLEDDISFQALSETVGFDARKLERILRLLFVRRIFCETITGFVGHTPVSTYLARNRELAAFLGHAAFEAFPAATRLAETIKRHPYTEEPNETGFNLALGTSDPFFTFLSKNPNRFDRFNLGQSGVSQTGSRSAEQAVGSFDWASLGNGTVVDVGGGNGHVSILLASAYPTLKFVVQDLADAVSAGAAAVPPLLKSRVIFQEHNMFKTNPIKHADAYYLRHILHDWPDKQAILILKALVPALKDGSRILISDTVIPPSGELSGLDEKFVRYIDMQMMVLHNSRERTEEDFKEILNEADPRLQLFKVWKNGPSSIHGSTLLEVRFREGHDGNGERPAQPE